MSQFKNPSLRYRIIDRELRRWPSITTARLHKIVQRELGQEITLRTIQNDLKRMQEPVENGGFDAPILQDKKKKTYSYTDEHFSILTFGLTEEDINAMRFYASCLKLYSDYSIFGSFSNAINKIVEGVAIRNKFSDKSFADLIIQTDTNPSPKGIEHLAPIVQAISERRLIKFTYQKFNETKGTVRCLAPYLLKEYRNRWYVLGMPERKKAVQTFALDRMVQLTLTEDTYEISKKFDHQKYFEHSFGITTADAAVEEVVLRFKNSEVPYLMSLPIHPSQNIIKRNKHFTDFSIQVIPSYELKEYILGKTPDVIVISPVHLRKEIQNAIEQGLQQYR